MIRLLTETDAKQFRHLRLLLLRTDPNSFLSSWSIEKNYSLEHFINKIIFSKQPPIFGYYGFFENNKLLAYGQISPSNLYKKRHIVTLYELGVHPNHQRKKMATKLITYLIKKVKDLGSPEQIHLWVNSKNKPGRFFYEKLGFEITAKIPQGVKENKKDYQDELLYCLKLK